MAFVIKKKKIDKYYYGRKIKNEKDKWVNLEIPTDIPIYKGRSKKEEKAIEQKVLEIGEKIYQQQLDKICEATHTDRSELTFEQYAEYFISICKLDVSTIKSYKETLDKHINPIIGNIKIKDLTQFHLNDYIQKKLAECIEKQTAIDEKIANAKKNNETVKISTSERPCTYSIKKHRDIIRLILSNAVNDGDLTENVAKKINKRLLQSLPKNDYEINPFSKAEIEKLLNAVKGTKLEVPIVLASALGLRREEVLGLKFSDIDFENMRIHIQDVVIKTNGVSSAIYRRKTKTKKSKTFMPMSAELGIYLMLVKKEHDKLREVLGADYDNHTITYEDEFNNIKEIDYATYDLDFVCRDEFGKVLKPNYISQNFRKLLEENDLRPTRFHDLRHSVGTIILEATNDMKLAQTTLRHSTINTTMDIYASMVSDEYKKQGTDVMSNLVGNVVNNKKND